MLYSCDVVICRCILDGPVAEPSEVNVDVVAVSRTKVLQLCEKSDLQITDDIQFVLLTLYKLGII